MVLYGAFVVVQQLQSWTVKRTLWTFFCCVSQGFKFAWGE